MIYVIESLCSEHAVCAVADSLGAAITYLKRDSLFGYVTTWGPLKKVRVYGNFHYKLEGSVYCPGRGRYAPAKTMPVKYIIRAYSPLTGSYPEPEFVEEIRARHRTENYVPKQWEMEPPRCLPDGYKFTEVFHP